MRSRFALGLAAALVVAAPVLVGVGYALLGSLGLVGVGAGGRPETGRLLRVLGSGAVWEGVGWSLWVAGASTALAFAAAVLLAALFRATTPADRIARALAVVPLPFPHLVAGVLGVAVLGQSGLLARAAHALGWIDAPAEMPALIYDPLGVGLVLSLAWKETPFLALVAFSVVAGRAAALEETARSLGADGWAVFRRVTWPVLWRGLLPATVAVFVFAFGSYEAAVLLAPSEPLALPLLTMERYTDAALDRRADAFVLVLIAMAVGAAAVAVHEWLRAGWEEFEG